MPRPVQDQRRRVVLLDTSVATSNEGDRIIAEAVRKHLSPVVDIVGQLATHRLPTEKELDQARELDPDLYLMAGTNVITGDAFHLTQWPLSPQLINLLIAKLVVLGGGWWSYESKRMRAKTRSLYQRMASPVLPWSVRDRFTQRRLEKNGIRSVYTGCPTTWDLDSWHTPTAGGRLVTTVTDYRASPNLDQAWIAKLSEQSADVRFWPQSDADVRYLAALGVARSAVIDTGLPAFSDALARADGYVGTRLHGGVFALQHGIPALIVTVDNRAVEMSQDCHLPIVSRDELARGGLPQYRKGQVLLPHRTIEGWLERLGWRMDDGTDDHHG